MGYEILKDSPPIYRWAKLLPYIVTKKYNNNAYPSGLKENETSIETQIPSIADTSSMHLLKNVHTKRFDH